MRSGDTQMLSFVKCLDVCTLILPDKKNLTMAAFLQSFPLLCFVLYSVTFDQITLIKFLKK